MHVWQRFVDWITGPNLNEILLHTAATLAVCGMVGVVLWLSIAHPR